MAGGTRSRHACARCKAQRLKCDEQQPTCGRCTRLNVLCTGPILRVRWSDKHELLHAKHAQGHSKADKSSPLPREDASSNSNHISQLINQWDDPLSAMRTDDNVTPEPIPAQPCPRSDPSQETSNRLEWHAQDPEISMPQIIDTAENDLLSTPVQPVTNTSDVDIILEGLHNFGNHSDLLPNLPEATPCRQSPTSACAQSSIGSPGSLCSDTHPVPRPIENFATILVEYYFRDTARILALYDSNMNPFRSTVSRLWSGSELIYFTLQSMAAASLSNVYPQMSSVGITCRQKAISIFETSEMDQVDEKTLIALFMIGGTSSWFDINDTGAKYFFLVREHVKRLTASGKLEASGKNSLFFKDLLTCWEMFLSFIVNDVDLGPCSTPSPLNDKRNDDLAAIFPSVQVPHPLTGVACDAQAYLARVGRLVRSNRRRINSKSFITLKNISQLQREVQEAFDLEASLFSYQLPLDTDIAHTGDEYTPIQHLTTLADVYRRVGLLQLYRVFPDVLEARVASEIQDQLYDRSGGHEEPSLTSEEWLRSFALGVVSSLASIPAESGTKDFHPFLLVSCCSELRLSMRPSLSSMAIPPTGTTTTMHELNASVSRLDSEVLDARRFLLGRLHTLQYSLPKKPIERCIEIVQSTWERGYSGDDTPVVTPYWMDVMIEKGWDAFMA